MYVVLQQGTQQIPSYVVGALFAFFGVALFCRWIWNGWVSDRKWPPFRRNMLLLLVMALYGILRGVLYLYVAYTRTITLYALVIPTTLYVVSMLLLIRLWAATHHMLKEVFVRASDTRREQVFKIVSLLLLVLTSLGTAVCAVYAGVVDDDDLTVNIVSTVLDCTSCIVVGLSMIGVCFAIRSALLLLSYQLHLQSGNHAGFGSPTGTYVGVQHMHFGASVPSPSSRSGGIGNTNSCCCTIVPPIARVPEHRVMMCFFVLGIYSIVRGMLIAWFAGLQDSKTDYRRDDRYGWWGLPFFYALELVTLCLTAGLLVQTPTRSEVRTRYFPHLSDGTVDSSLLPGGEADGHS